MCLLAVLSRLRPDTPLVVGANRDELLARPAVTMTVLGTGPRVLGGRDLLAGGTWLAVNEHGVMAALTNRPAPSGRDPTRRSRGELPLRAAAHTSASEAVRSLVEGPDAIDPRDYNPCWLLVGDREALFYLEIGPVPLAVEALPPGLWVLENRPLRAPSAKADAVRAALAGVIALDGEPLITAIATVLRSHQVPQSAGSEGDGPRPREVEAPCVHAGVYGTRSSAIVVVPSAPSEPPQVRYTDGPPCTSPWQDAAALWSA